ncbi:MAG: SUMF1/EgtB/PvdO family nonheme iron enzyme, partial [Desulfomonile tiedjei]|nr:SUMF1/EgtB/PvdO family nonheme iron enzyme [Desulfomonile tiedjei]
MLGIAELPSKRLSLFAVVFAWLLLCGGPQSGFSASESSTPANDINLNASDQGEANASRLFEAVSGYLDGYRRPSAAKVTLNPGMQRRESPARPEDRTEDLLKAEADHKLAGLRIQRREWDLATISLERALHNSIVASSPDEKEKLRQLLQETKRNGAATAEKSPSSGEMVNSQGMRMILIQPGVFTMGTSAGELRRIQNEWSVEETLIQPETPAHKVRITRPFLIGKYAVTVGEFKKFVSETGYRTVAEKQGWGWAYDDSTKNWVKKNGASWKNPGTQTADDYPVTLVCHSDAEAFCEWLSKRDGRPYFLPTEAQWEYAARGGQQGERFPWGSEYPDGKKLNIADRKSPVPWADRTLDDGYGGVSPVGNYQPNGFWLYDITGNVWQPCSDYFDPKTYESRASQTVADPTGPAAGKTKVVRGGNWAFDAGIARTAFRFGVDPDLCTDMSGIRVTAAVLPGEESASKHSDQNSLGNESLARLLDRVKGLVASGKRLEARKIVEEFAAKGSGQKSAIENPASFAKNVLDTVIDVSEDKGAQSFKNSAGMTMVRIPAGSFVMGSSESDVAWAMGTLAQGQPVSLENEYPFHKVRISRPFYISSSEVTVRQFRAFVDDTGYVTDAEDAKGGQSFNAQNRRFERKDGTSWKNPGWNITQDQPAVMISYNDAQAFVEWLSAKE